MAKSPKQHEIPPEDYIWISGIDIAIHKGFLKWFSIGYGGIIAAATVIGCLTNWWQTLIAAILTFFYIQNPIIGFPATLISAGILYLWYHRRQKRIQKEKAKQAYNRRLASATIKLAEEGVKQKNE